MKKIKLSIILIIAAILVASYFLLSRDEAVLVTSMQAYKGGITKTVEVSGSINSPDVELILIEPSMKVNKVYVKENDIVKKDQILAELDSNELEISLKKAKLNLAELEANLNDTLLEKSNLALLENALSRNNEEYEKLSRDLENAKENLIKAEVLFNEDAISKVEYDSFVSAVNDTTTSLKKAELNLNDANLNYKSYGIQKQLDQGSLDRQIQSLRLDIENLNEKIEETKIYSSVNGILTEFPLQESRNTLTGQEISIYSTEVFEFTAQAAQKDAALVKEGQKAIVIVDGISSSYDGIVSYVAKEAEIDRENNSMLPKVKIKIEVTNPDENLVFGYEGEAKIVVESKEDALIIKNEALRKEEDKEFVYVLEGNSAKKTYVETGLTDGYLTNIQRGLDENDLVIVNPSLELEDGMNVRALEQ